MEHRIKVVTKRAGRGFGPGFKSHVECSCGYRSITYDYKDWAARDAKKHVEATNVRA